MYVCVCIYEGGPKNYQKDAAACAVFVVRESAASYLFNYTFSVNVPNVVDAKCFLLQQL